MNDAFKELQSVRFWLLATTTIFLGIILNAIVKAIVGWIRTKVSREKLSTVYKEISNQTDWSGILSEGAKLIFILQSYFLLLNDYYWTVKITACLIGVYRALDLASFLYQNLPSNSIGIEKFVRREAILVFLTSWISFFGVPRAAYWVTEFQYATSVQVAIFLILFLCSYRLINLYYIIRKV